MNMRTRAFTSQDNQRSLSLTPEAGPTKAPGVWPLTAGEQHGTAQNHHTTPLAEGGK